MWFGVVLAVLALVFASVALIVRDGSGSSTSGSDVTTVELTEFALSPASVTVPAGGSLEVVNAGTAAHNLSIVDSGIATTDLAAGDTETLDLSSLAPGEYQIICTIPGHADSGMTGTLTVTEGGAGGSPAPAAGGGEADAAAGHDHGAMMTEAEYAEMSEAMNATVGEFPAETEGVGNQVLDPVIAADGTKVFELTAAVTPWEVEPGKVVDAWTYNGMVPGPRMHVDVGDRVEIVLHNELPMATDVHIHGVNLPNSMDGVAPVTQDLVQPGETFTYAFTTDEVAVAMYHAHHHGQMQMPNGLLGTLFVGDVPLPAGRTIGGEAVPADVRVARRSPWCSTTAGSSDTR